MLGALASAGQFTKSACTWQMGWLSSRAAKGLQPDSSKGVLSVSQKGHRKTQQQGTKQHSHSALVSTIPNPAGLSHDRGGIVEGLQKPSDLSVTDVKKRRLSSSLFPITPCPPPRAVTGVMPQCHQTALNHRKGEEPFPGETWTWNHTLVQ